MKLGRSRSRDMRNFSSSAIVDQDSFLIQSNHDMLCTAGEVFTMLQG